MYVSSSFLILFKVRLIYDDVVKDPIHSTYLVQLVFPFYKVGSHVIFLELESKKFLQFFCDYQLIIHENKADFTFKLEIIRMVPCSTKSKCMEKK
jgi:hypothetical protein